jgi:hypothetical protein
MGVGRMDTIPDKVQTGLERGLFWAGIVLAVAGCYLGAAGTTWPALWLGLPLVPWGVLLGWSPEVRASWEEFLRQRWAALRESSPVDGLLRWQAAFLFVTVPAGCFFLANNRNMASGDSWPVMPTALSVVHEGKLAVEEYLPLVPQCYVTPELGRPYCLIERGTGWYSSYPQGMVPFALPAVLAQTLTGQPVQPPRLGRLEKWTASWVAAFALGLFFLLALRSCDRQTACLATALLGFGSVFTTTLSQALWQQGGVIFWALLAFWIEFQPAARSRGWGILVQGFALAMMLACRLSAAVFVVPFGVWILCRDVRRAFLLTGAALVFYAPWMALYATIYGTPFGPSMGQLTETNSWGRNIPGGLAGVLFSPGRGLFVYQPFLLLVPLGLYLARARKSSPEQPHGWRLFVLAFVTLHLLVVASWGCWWGGDCWGSRLLAEVVPFLLLLALPAVTALAGSLTGRTILGLFFALALLLHVRELFFATFWEGVYKDVPRPELIWSWPRAPFLTPPCRG